MSFVTEDGTGLSTSNSYVSVAEADAWFAESTALWTGVDAVKQKALVRATRTIDLMGGNKFLGIKLVETQALAWPRDEAYDRDGIELTGIPIYLKRAVYEAALQELTTEGVTMPNTTQQVEMERVEGAVQVSYVPGSYQGTTFRAIKGWLDYICKGSGLRVVRV